MNALEELISMKKLDRDFAVNQLSLRDLGKGVIGVPYFGQTGEELFERKRNPQGKKPRFQQPKGVSLEPYGLWKLENAYKVGRLYLTEGESDTWTLWHCGLPALGLPGAGTAGALQQAHIEGIGDIYLLPDNDEQGTAFVEGVCRKLSELGYGSRLYRIQVPEEHKDVSDWYCFDPGEFKIALARATEDAERLSIQDGKSPKDRNGFNENPSSSKANSEPERSESKAASMSLVKLFEETGAELFHTSMDLAFARIPHQGHHEVLSITSKEFRRWFKRLLYTKDGRIARRQAVHEALDVLEAKAFYEGPECAVHVRVAENQGHIYIDLANPDWQVVEINSSGWQIIGNAPVRFRRHKGMRALPVPITGGKIDELLRFVNVSDGRDWYLLIAWLLQALRPHGPYPVLCLHGQQGSAKSTLARLLRSLIDPNHALLRSEPRDQRDLIIAATNSWCICLDNLSALPQWLSDALCRLSTGGGLSTRQLYSDSEETIFDVTRPCLLNGIEDLATRGDLLERAILLNLPPIPENKRCTEESLWKAFESAKPRILGALFSAVSDALRVLPSIRLPFLPRMADFCKWAVAGEVALGWKTGSFLNAYGENRSQANQVALDASLLVPFVRRFAEERRDWTGTASQLDSELKALAGEAVNSKDWPGSPRVLSGQLRRLAPNLRTLGVCIDFDRDEGKNRTRLILIRWQPNSFRDSASAVSAASKDSQIPSETEVGSDTRGRNQPIADAGPDATRNGDTGTQDATDATDTRNRGFPQQ